MKINGGRHAPALPPHYTPEEITPNFHVGFCGHSTSGPNQAGVGLNASVWGLNPRRAAAPI